MTVAETVNTASDTLLALGGLFITARFIQAHRIEQRGHRAAGDDDRARLLQRARTIRQLASLQHPRFLALVALVTLAKIVAGLALLSKAATG